VTLLLAAYPVTSCVWMVGGFPIRGYAPVDPRGNFAAVLWSQRRYAARGGNREVVPDAAPAVPAGTNGASLPLGDGIGARTGALTEHPRLRKITNGGLGIWGAVIGGGLAAWRFSGGKHLALAPS
jgi:prolipoprotein diacylglyceryltransferase